MDNQLSIPDNSYDVVIIGGGPAGASCALYTARAKLSAVVLDKSPASSALASTSRIANYPGVRGEVNGAELLSTIRAQAEDFGARFIRTTAVGVNFEVEPKLVYTQEGVFAARAVVIATGSMSRKARVPGEEQFLGRGVSYCATCDAAFYVDQEVAMIGDSDIAVEEALFLTRFAKTVHLIAPGAQLRAWKELVQSAEENERIVIHLETKLQEIYGDEAVQGIRVIDASGESKTIPLYGVFILLPGTAPTTEFLGGAVPLTELGCVAVDEEKQTVVPGVYAIGDVTCTHIKQAIIAASDGVMAALAIDKYLNQRERVKLDYK
ncbi:MAG TPA: FAD-dependent oxidoreductase [Armatimonadota bacterium]|nr:FAD-dependent oxidoreductase [Armatimonadota bacterium]